ncbi:SID1 transmembrane family member 2 isoform X5 [Varanus komodoensis]|uniref:SID1 transmembrane family member 2 isoform X5 n=1 Tax=Varanus komodoensis TaxID=61221 RepID=UPI001CF7B2BE|nr:SID1 transmembrane family member 2 isoform X5 [Varanus komodoensis]
MDAVNGELLNIYAFNHTVTRNRTEGVRVSVNVLSEQKESPVLFVVRQKEAVVSFQVPLILRGLYQRKYLYQDVSRTLCQPETKSEFETQYFYVDVSTLSSCNASYQLQVTRVENFVLRTGEHFSFNATASRPQYFKYEFPAGVDSAIVKVTSATAFPCSVISIQDILCPVYDLDNNVAFIGMYQTMTKKAAITVQKKDFPSHSFYVVVVVKTEDEACGGSLHYYPFSKDEPVDQGNRQKTLDVVVSPAVTSQAYVSGVLFSLGVFLSFYVLTMLLACWENWRHRKEHLGLLAALDTPSAETASLLGHARLTPDAILGRPPYNGYGYGSFDNASTASTENVTDSLLSTEASYAYAGSVPAPPATLGHCYGSLAGERGRAPPSGLPQLCGRGRVRHAGRHRLGQERHPHQAIPVRGRPRPEGQARAAEEVPDLLLEHRHHRRLLRAARHPAGHHLPDGCQRDREPGHLLLQLPVCPPLGQPQRLQQHPQQPGLRPAGAALPAHHPAAGDQPQPGADAQRPAGRDTSFMYMIAGLCMLKLYQKRHPDINASAYSAYACLAGVIFFSVVGVVFGKGNLAFWIVFSIIHILSTLLLSTQLYYMGRWKLDSGVPRRILHVLYTDCIRQCSGPMYVDRMALLVMGNIINWSLAAYGLIVRPNDFASYLLAIGICNLLLYFAFYIIMKLRSGERLKPMPLLCIVCTSVVWGFALFFFFQGLSTWQKTPAESREHNRDCILLDFFDDHDVWHFLSSIAMFGSFLVLLTLDDDLDCVQRDKIYVF